MCRTIHQLLLVGIFFIFALGSLFSLLLIFPALLSPLSFDESFSRRAIAVTFLAIPPLILWWSINILTGLPIRIHPESTRSLVYFYTANLLYCGMWVLAPMTRDGVTRNMFGHAEIRLGLILLFTPLLITIVGHFWCRKQDAKTA